MAAPSALTATAYLQPAMTAVPGVTVQLVQDSSWSPRVAAVVTMPYTSARALALDPRTTPRPRLSVEVRRTWVGGLTLDDLSVLWSGKVLDDLTTLYAGKTLSDLSVLFGVDWGSGVTKDPDIFTADLVVRARDVDYGAATITVRCASDELIAQDTRPGVLTVPFGSLPDQLLALLAAGGVPVVAYDFTAGAGLIAMPAYDVDWTMSTWDAMNRLVIDQGLKLWCDHTRTWRLGNPLLDVPPTGITASRLEGATDSTNLDGDYADAIVWLGTGTDAAGNVFHDTKTWPPSPPAGPIRWHQESVDYGVFDGASLPMPSDTELASRLALLQSASRVLTLTGVADPTVRPGQTIGTGSPSAPGMSAVVGRVEYQVPADTMTVTTLKTTEP